MTKSFLRRQRRKASYARRHGHLFVPLGTQVDYLAYTTPSFIGTPYTVPTSGDYAYTISSVDSSAGTITMSGSQHVSSGAALSVDMIQAAGEAAISRSGRAEMAMELSQAGLLDDTGFLRMLGL